MFMHQLFLFSFCVFTLTLRAAYQAGHVWGQALCQELVFPSPADFGWVESHSEWTVRYLQLRKEADRVLFSKQSSKIIRVFLHYSFGFRFDGSRYPSRQTCKEVIHCGCKLRCSGRCSCSKANLPCTGLCGCGCGGCDVNEC